MLQDTTKIKTLRKLLQIESNKGVLKEYDLLSYAQKVKFLEMYNESNMKLFELFQLSPFCIKNFSKPEESKKKYREQDTLINLSDKIIVSLISSLLSERNENKQGLLEKIISLARKFSYRLFKIKLISERTIKHL